VNGNSIPEQNLFPVERVVDKHQRATVEDLRPASSIEKVSQNGSEDHRNQDQQQEN
jgi:hypothetical protein